MKRFIMPKFEKTDSDYKFWGLSIPKLPNVVHRPQVIKQDITMRNNAVINEDAIKPKAVNANSSSVAHLSERPLERSRSEERSVNYANTPDQTQADNCKDPFADIVFSFFSSTDQHYVVHKSPNDVQESERCQSEEAGNEYEVMNAKTPSPDAPNTIVHKSELTFYVSAASLKGSCGSVANASNYDLPTNGTFRRSRSSSIFITQHRSLNDLHATDKDNQARYQNSASLDNLSQVCNVSLKDVDNKRHKFTFPKFAHSDKAVKLKNRLSALYSNHKSFKGKKRISKAWYGIKEWFEAERYKLDKAIHGEVHQQKAEKSSGDGYPESDFSDYEDVDISDFNNSSVAHQRPESPMRFDRKGGRSRSVCNSIFKLNLVKENSGVFHVNDPPHGGSLRQSRSQPSVMIISEPVLLNIKCDGVDNDVESCLQFSEEDASTATGAVSPSRTPAIDGNMDAANSASGSQDRGGFVELKSVVKEGTSALKELINILQQRAEAERQYSSTMLRISARSRRASKGNNIASLTFRRTAIDMDRRAQMHREFSNQLIEEVVRHLQRLVATRDTVRKQVERDVGVTSRRLTELRTSEARNKKLSHASARFNERIQDTILQVGATTTQEADLRRKKVKSEEAAIKSDVEYYMACLRAERARVECETTVKKCSETLLRLEDDRCNSVKYALKKYINLTTTLGEAQSYDEALKSEEYFESILCSEKQRFKVLLTQPPPSMHLPDFYCQHTTLAMNKERRRQALLKILQLIKTDMERERKSKQALEKLSLAITTTTNFGTDSQQNVSEKLYHMRSVLTYLEGARIQAAGYLANLAGRERIPHPLSPHLKVERDRRGLQHTILTVPQWLQYEYKGTVQSIDDEKVSPPSSPVSPDFISMSSDRGAADGVSIQHYSDIDDNPIEQLPERPPPPSLSIAEMSSPVHC